MSTSNDSQPPPPPDPLLVLSGKCPVTSLLFLGNNSDVIVTGHQNGQLQEWSIPKRRAVTSWTGHSDTVLWLACVDEGRILLSQGRDGLVRAWSRDTGQWSITEQVPSAPLIFCNSAIIDSTSHKLLAVPSDETSHVSIHSVTIPTPQPDQDMTFSISKTPIRILSPIEVKGYGMCMRMCPIETTHDAIGEHLLVGYESGVIALWNTERGEMLHNLKLHDDSIMGLTCQFNSSSGQIKGLSVSVSNEIQCWKIFDNNTIRKDNSIHVTNKGFNDVAIRKDGRIFVTGGWDNSGRVFGLKKLRPLAVLTYHKDSINCVAFSPDNELVLASKDGYITFWDVYKNS